MFTTYTVDQCVGIKDSTGAVIRVAGCYSPATTVKVVKACNEVSDILPNASDFDIIKFVTNNLLNVN